MSEENVSTYILAYTKNIFQLKLLIKETFSVPHQILSFRHII